MLKTTLVILTLGYGGTTHLAVSEAETQEDCLAKAEVLDQILTGAGAKITALRCGQTDLRLTPYNHSYAEGELRWHYHIKLHGTEREDGFTMTPTAAGRCSADGADEFCTISAQAPVEE
ncbi:hypothetical protein [uncultured Aliiroseovarius sp.]|uniref:hypothetical protein n=1 Tax=uncultured Aliiroseovarius sp. TaxID=1658783 RepID=UPI0025921DAA|nr:hypothetical protein [uncultured Aliiroseovarius sp.]